MAFSWLLQGGGEEAACNEAPTWLGRGDRGVGGSLLGNYREIMRASSSPQPPSSSFSRTRQVTFSFFCGVGGSRGGGASADLESGETAGLLVFSSSTSSSNIYQPEPRLLVTADPPAS